MKWLFFIFFCYLSFNSVAESAKFWVFFTEKDLNNYHHSHHLTPEALKRRMQQGIPLWQETDAPVSEAFLNNIRQQGIEPLVVSKWLNGFTARLTPDQQAWLLKQPYVAGIQPANQYLLPARTNKTLSQTPTNGKPAMGLAAAQLAPEALQAKYLNGSGVAIGVMDVGFFKADKNLYLTELFKNGQVKAVLDLVNPKQKELFSKMETSSDGHGTTVLQMIAGKNESEQLGLAMGASFYLARTDHGTDETRTEEDHWVRAMEWMDSLGVALINTSLGYSTGFNNPKENYTPEQMDGKTSIIARATKIATEEKGILVIVSAGNEGNLKWKIVSTPADAESVIAVGATNQRGLKMGYSSIGPEFLPYTKPDVSCFSKGGTSFAAPVITGMAACLWQAFPQATNLQVAEAIRKSAPLYPFPNNYVGYGIPNAARAIEILKKGKVSVEAQRKKANGKEKVEIKIPKEWDARKGVVFHKKDERIVVQQALFNGGKRKVQLTRPEDKPTQSTFVFGVNAVEVIWE